MPAMKAMKTKKAKQAKAMTASRKASTAVKAMKTVKATKTKKAMKAVKRPSMQAIRKPAAKKPAMRKPAKDGNKKKDDDKMPKKKDDDRKKDDDMPGWLVDPFRYTDDDGVIRVEVSQVEVGDDGTDCICTEGMDVNQSIQAMISSMEFAGCSADKISYQAVGIAVCVKKIDKKKDDDDDDKKKDDDTGKDDDKKKDDDHREPHTPPEWIPGHVYNSRTGRHEPLE